MLDLTDWQNKKYQTRDGRPVRILCVDAEGDYPIFGLLNNREITAWHEHGKFTSTGLYPENDLVNAKTKREGWVNIYPKNPINLNKECIGFMYKSKDIADEMAGNSRISCIKIEWEE